MARHNRYLTDRGFEKVPRRSVYEINLPATGKWVGRNLSVEKQNSKWRSSIYFMCGDGSCCFYTKSEYRSPAEALKKLYKIVKSLNKKTSRFIKDTINAK